MQMINSGNELRMAILALEIQQSDEGRMLKEHLHIAYESIKPINLIKSAFKEVSESQDLRDASFNTFIGLTVGYFSKIVFERISNNPFKKLFGTALQFAIANVVAKNPETTNFLGKGFLKISGRLLSNFRDYLVSGSPKLKSIFTNY